MEERTQVIIGLVFISLLILIHGARVVTGYLLGKSWQVNLAIFLAFVGFLIGIVIHYKKKGVF